MKTINMVGNLAGGVFNVVKKGILYIAIGSAVGATFITLLVAMIIWAM